MSQLTENGKKVLVKYVRFCDKPIGVVVALDKDKIGWSQCCPRDKFDKKRGLEIAIGRAKKGSNVHPAIRSSWDYDIIGETIKEMKERAKRYFKLEN